MPQTIRFQNSLLCLLRFYGNMMRAISMYYIQNDPQLSLINLIIINWHHVIVT